jgi:predicted NAD/FAD-binding protein
MRELGVALRPSTMSFSVSCERCNLEFSGHGLRGLFRTLPA